MRRTRWFVTGSLVTGSLVGQKTSPVSAVHSRSNEVPDIEALLTEYDTPSPCFVSS